MSAAYYDTETELLKRADGTPFVVITRVFATTTQREIANGITRDITETREVASFHNHITPDTPEAEASPGQPEKKENA